MPNHIHFIIQIKDVNETNEINETERRGEASAPPTVFQIIRSFKSRCSNEYCRYIEGNNLNISGKLWQRNYYEHIIRDENDYNRILEYIKNNPSNWQNDENNIQSRRGRVHLAPRSRNKRYLNK